MGRALPMRIKAESLVIEATKCREKRRGRQRCPIAHAAILNAALDLLKTKSLRDVSADGIALRAGVSKATIYKWWPHKNLVALDAFLTQIQREVPIPDTGSVQLDFTKQLRSVVDFYATPLGRLFAQFVAEGQSDPEFLKIFRERFLKSRRDTVRTMWQRGVARGEVSASVDCNLVIDLIYGPLVFRLLTGHGPLNSAEATAIVAAVFAGVGGSTRSTKRSKRTV